MHSEEIWVRKICRKILLLPIGHSYFLIFLQISPNLNENSFLDSHSYPKSEILLDLLSNVHKKYGMLSVDQTFNNLYDILQYCK